MGRRGRIAGLRAVASPPLHAIIDGVDLDARERCQLALWRLPAITRLVLRKCTLVRALKQWPTEPPHGKISHSRACQMVLRR